MTASTSERSGGLIIEMLVRGRPDEEIIRTLAERFPDQRCGKDQASAKSQISSFRSWLRAGKIALGYDAEGRPREEGLSPGDPRYGTNQLDAAAVGTRAAGDATPSRTAAGDALRSAFEAFRADPAERFRVRLRRERARQIRRLLSDPASIDLATFNREVWAFESDTRLRGEPIKGVLFGALPLSSERVEELESALDAGELELHGNYVWGSGAKFYGIQLRNTEEDEKLSHVRAAVSNLNDGGLSPSEKAKRIIEIPGLGRNTATGMVMLFHPDEFNLWNGKSERFAEMLGEKASTLDKFERLAGEWRGHVGAEDALEFDWFLCRVVDGKIPLAVRPKAAAPGGRCWAMGLGEGGRLWSRCREAGIVAIGMDRLGDFRQFKSKEEFTDAIRAVDGGDLRPTNDALACYQFAYEMSVGDYVFAKRGMTELYGIGIVESDYIYDPDRPEYRNVRRVKWLVDGPWTIPDDARVPLKTLTDVTKYRAFLDFALPLRDTPAFDFDGTPRSEETPSPHGDAPDTGYSIDDALQGLFMPKEEFRAMLDSLARKKNVVLQGPPGVGKTYVARRLAYALIGAEDDAKVEVVQFHQSYSYEDFIQGWRPRESGGFELRNGVFHDFCRVAARDEKSTYVFVIDEINRGNLSKIFGELMMLIEGDKRGPKHAIPLTYSKGRGDRFFVPANVHLIGTMNTADRSLAMVDYALRRRFTFIDLRPRFDGDAFRAHLAGLEVEPGVIDAVIERMGRLNELIRSEKTNLGPGFEIGHSFFCPQETESDLGADWYRDVVRSEIEPLLREYWFDAPEKAAELAEKLLA